MAGLHRGAEPCLSVIRGEAETEPLALCRATIKAYARDMNVPQRLRLIDALADIAPAGPALDDVIHRILKGDLNPDNIPTGD